MALERRLTVLVSALVVLVWALAFTEGLSATELICALLSTALSSALLLTVSARLSTPPGAPVLLSPRSETTEFQRELAHLCAALKFGISFCERHPEARPDALLQEVEEMGDAILVFVNRMARPVCLQRRAGCTAEIYQPGPSAP